MVDLEHRRYVTSAKEASIPSIASLKTSLDRWAVEASPFIGDHSSNTILLAGKLLTEISDSLEHTDNGCISVPYSALCVSKPGDCQLQVEQLERRKFPLESAVWLATPADPSDTPEFIKEPAQGQRLIKLYTDLFHKVPAELRYMHNRQVENGSHFLIVVLPKESSFPSWVTPHGPLRIITNNAARLFTEGVGFHPEHEQDHTIRQIGYPEAQYTVVNRLRLFDEMLAINAEMQAFKTSLPDPNTLDIYSDLFVSALPMRVRLSFDEPPLPVAYRDSWFSNGNLAFYISSLLKSGTRGPMFDDDIGVQVYADLKRIFGNGNTARRLRAIIDTIDFATSQVSFSDLSKPVFDTSKYPFFLAFSLFLGRFNSLFKSKVDQFLEKEMSYGASPAEVYAKTPSAVISQVNELKMLDDPVSDSDTYYTWSFLRYIDRTVIPYLKSEGIEPKTMPSEDLEEQMWKIILAQLITGSHRVQLHLIKSRINGSEDNFVRDLFNVLQQVKVKEAIEKIWKEQAGKWLQQMLSKVSILTLNGRE